MSFLSMVLMWSALSYADEAGDALARKVVEKSGNPYRVSRVRFSFIVEAAGVEKARRTHDWHPIEGRLTVHTGDTATKFENLGQHDPSPWVANPTAHAAQWAVVAPGTSPDEAAKAWSAWINDGYWLFAPSKLLDPGVTRTVDAAGHLVLTFDGVGVTPGDTYTLTISPEDSLVTAWTFRLQSERTGSVLWTEYQTFGPLTLSTRRQTEAGDFVVRFADIEVQP